jgi:hypothetical protein
MRLNRFVCRVALADTVLDDSAADFAAVAHFDHLVGSTRTCTSHSRPSAKVRWNRAEAIDWSSASSCHCKRLLDAESDVSLGEALRLEREVSMANNIPVSRAAIDTSSRDCLVARGEGGRRVPLGPASLRQNPSMTLSPRASRRTLWAVACVLALKSAVPLFASVAAAAQGRPVADICEVYGVATVAPAAPFHHPSAHHRAGPQGSPPAPEHGSAGAHAGDHCALTALAAGAPPGAPGLAPIARLETATACVRPAESRLRDACAEWAARLRHGPPVLA